MSYYSQTNRLRQQLIGQGHGRRKFPRAHPRPTELPRAHGLTCFLLALDSFWKLRETVTVPVFWAGLRVVPESRSNVRFSIREKIPQVFIGRLKRHSFSCLKMNLAVHPVAVGTGRLPLEKKLLPSFWEFLGGGPKCPRGIHLGT